MPSRALPDFCRAQFALLAIQMACVCPCVVERARDLHLETRRGLRRSGRFQSNPHPTEGRFAVPEVLATVR